MAALLLLKEVPRVDAAVRRGDWPMVEAAQFGLFELRSRKVGIVGLGAVGLEVTKRLQPFGPSLIAYAEVREVPLGAEQALGLERMTLARLLAQL